MATLVREVSHQVARDIGRDAGERVSPLKALLIGQSVEEDEHRRPRAGGSARLTGARGRPAHSADVASARARGGPGAVPSQSAAHPKVDVRADVPVLRRKFLGSNQMQDEL